MTDRAAKLFRLLIDEATADGERRSAAAMLRKVLAAEEVDIDEIQWKRGPLVTPQPDTTFFFANRPMPFGKYKGMLVRVIPSEYLWWILEGMTDPKPWLREAAIETLRARSEYGGDDDL